MSVQQAAREAPALAYQCAVSMPQTVGGRVLASRLARQLRALPGLSEELDAHRLGIADELERMAESGFERTVMNSLLHELYAWANTSIGGRRVCRISLF